MAMNRSCRCVWCRVGPSVTVNYNFSHKLRNIPLGRRGPATAGSALEKKKKIRAT